MATTKKLKVHVLHIFEYRQNFLQEFYTIFYCVDISKKTLSIYTNSLTKIISALFFTIATFGYNGDISLSIATFHYNGDNSYCSDIWLTATFGIKPTVLL